MIRGHRGRDVGRSRRDGVEDALRGCARGGRGLATAGLTGIHLDCGGDVFVRCARWQGGGRFVTVRGVRRIAGLVCGALLGFAVPQSAWAEAPAAHPVETVAGVGAVFYPSAGGVVPRVGGPHFCSAGVVASASRDVIVTAAHCVLGTGALIEFAPLLHDDQLPAGVWAVTSMYVDPAWQRSFDPRHDVAFLRISPRDGKHIGDVVPGLPVGEPRAGDPVTVSGYPLGSGGEPLTCTAPLELTADGSAMHCSGFGDGTSGGPWVQNGRIVGVIGGPEQGGCEPDVEYSTPFGPDVEALLARAEAAGPGDVLPIGFTANRC
ncbi:trypsin-like serine peptidase [Nocardia yunnanensis]|uniref:trypsin-like serine peptidase n=1 Tax=Nocardia yunnanensis TaxID=2382165 RepID=UPI002482C9C0|nr:serine protease [Nocardia yunnanensis]